MLYMQNKIQYKLMKGVNSSAQIKENWSWEGMMSIMNLYHYLFTP